MRRTKQGVRDLNPRGYNGRGTKPGRPVIVCAHVWDLEQVERNVWYRRCVFCGEVRR